MSFVEWFFGGANFKYIRKGKVGDIIYPAHNNTNGWFKSPRWDLVTEVDKKGNIIIVNYIWDFSTVKALELWMLLKKQKGVKNNGK